MNMTGPTISSRVKISEVLSAVREMSKRLSQQDITDEQLKLFYKISLLEVASLLNGSLNPTYLQYTSFDQPANRPIVVNLPSDLDRIVAVGIKNSTGSTNIAQCILKPVHEYLAVELGNVGTSVYSNSVIACQLATSSGSELRILPGTEIYNSKMTNAGTPISLQITVYYLRQPKIDNLNYETDYVDLPDKYVPLLVKRIYSYCLLQIQGDIPTNFSNEMASDYRQIAEFLNAEMLNRNMQGLERK